jgi:hypothetical protein
VRSFAGKSFAGGGSRGLRVDRFFVALEVDCFFVAFGFDRVDTIGVDTLSWVEIESIYKGVLAEASWNQGKLPLATN